MKMQHPIVQNIYLIGLQVNKNLKKNVKTRCAVTTNIAQHYQLLISEMGSCGRNKETHSIWNIACIQQSKTQLLVYKLTTAWDQTSPAPMQNRQTFSVAVVYTIVHTNMYLMVILLYLHKH